MLPLFMVLQKTLQNAFIFFNEPITTFKIGISKIASLEKDDTRCF